MNFFKDKDPMGLNKLDREFTKIFKSDKIKTGAIGDPSMGKSKRYKPGQKKQVSNIEIAKAFFKYFKDVVKFFYQFATRNNIPGTYEEIIAMRDKLKLDEQHKIESNQAIQEIKEYQARAKQIRRLERQVTIERIKRKLLFIKYLKKHPLVLIWVLFGGTALIILILGILFPR